jgi:indolepyruvate ferredoxin oxidoreductase, beta subunit
MSKNRLIHKAQGIVLAGVGGQGVLTLAQLLLQAARLSGLYALQSEVHGMSQRGGAVNAQVVFDSLPVHSPTVLEGGADLLIGLEPLEALRHLQMLSLHAPVVVSTAPVINIPLYPSMEDILTSLQKIPGTYLVDTAKIDQELSNPHAGNVALLGMASNFMPIEESAWQQAFKIYFSAKGEKLIHQNMEAFNHGKSLKERP